MVLGLSYSVSISPSCSLSLSHSLTFGQRVFCTQKDLVRAFCVCTQTEYDSVFRVLTLSLITLTLRATTKCKAIYPKNIFSTPTTKRIRKCASVPHTQQRIKRKRQPNRQPNGHRDTKRKKRELNAYTPRQKRTRASVQQNAEKVRKESKKSTRKFFRNTEFLAPPTLYTSFIGCLHEKNAAHKIKVRKITQKSTRTQTLAQPCHTHTHTHQRHLHISHMHIDGCPHIFHTDLHRTKPYKKSVPYYRTYLHCSVEDCFSLD